MHGFIEVYDENRQSRVLINIAHIETVVEESWGCIIHLALQNPDGNEGNVYHLKEHYESICKKIENAQK